MAYKVITAVATEPVSLAEARLQCKVDSDDTSYDALLTALCTAAREYAEHHTGRALASQVLELALDAFPTCYEDSIVLPRPPVASITSIKYYDTAGVLQTMSSSLYALSTYGIEHKVSLTYGNTWPSTQAIPDAVQVRFVCGYAAASQGAEFAACPKAAKAAMLLHIELESPINSHTPAERETLMKARDALLNTITLYGH